LTENEFHEARMAMTVQRLIYCIEEKTLVPDRIRKRWTVVDFNKTEEWFKSKKWIK